jgi:DNA-binding GntR family transcriptional regulator
MINCEVPFLKTSKKKPLERKVLRHEIKKIIADAIVNGDLAPGDRIIETKIARELEVSQAPVREAIRELEQMGLVETQPYKGSFVRLIRGQEFSEAYKLRSLLEGYAARITAENINEDLLKKFKKLVEEMYRCAEEEERFEFIESDVAFHELIIKSTESDLFFRVWSLVNMIYLPFLTFVKSTMSLGELVLQHERILDAFVKKDPEAACKAVQMHIEGLGEIFTHKLT